MRFDCLIELTGCVVLGCLCLCLRWSLRLCLRDPVHFVRTRSGPKNTCQKVRRNGRCRNGRFLWSNARKCVEMVGMHQLVSFQSFNTKCDKRWHDLADQMNRHSYRYSYNQCCATRFRLSLVTCSLCLSCFMSIGQAVY